MASCDFCWKVQVYVTSDRFSNIQLCLKRIRLSPYLFQHVGRHFFLLLKKCSFWAFEYSNVQAKLWLSRKQSEITGSSSEQFHMLWVSTCPFEYVLLDLRAPSPLHNNSRLIICPWHAVVTAFSDRGSVVNPVNHLFAMNPRRTELLSHTKAKQWTGRLTARQPSLSKEVGSCIRNFLCSRKHPHPVSPHSHLLADRVDRPKYK